MAYDLRGTFLEACDCYVICPCWAGEGPDGGHCTGLFVWYVREGTIDGVDVSGLSTASASVHEGHRSGGGWRVSMLIDERASAEQREALVSAFSGKMGGPLAELAELTAEVVGIHAAGIALTEAGGATRVAITPGGSADMAPIAGSTGRTTTLADGALSGVLGTPVEVGRGAAYRLDLPADGFDVDVAGRSANRGRFAYSA
jgi:hypothetical protein